MGYGFDSFHILLPSSKFTIFINLSNVIIACLWESPFPATVVLMLLTMVSTMSTVIAAPFIPTFSVVSDSDVLIIDVSTRGK